MNYIHGCISVYKFVKNISVEELEDDLQAFKGKYAIFNENDSPRYLSLLEIDQIIENRPSYIAILESVDRHIIHNFVNETELDRFLDS